MVDSEITIMATFTATISTNSDAQIPDRKRTKTLFNGNCVVKYAFAIE